MRDAVRLPTEAPFHLEATVRVLQRRPSNPVERWDGERYLRAIATPHGRFVVAVANRGSVDRPDVRLELVSREAPREARRQLVAIVRTMLGLDADPAPLERALSRVPALRRTARDLRGMRPPRFASLFETFVNVVPFQQLSVDAGIAILARLVERLGEHVVCGSDRLAAYPSAETVAKARLPTLAACGLSRSKGEALRAHARAIRAGALDAGKLEKAATNEALARLTALPGIGAWSASLVLLRGFGRLDVFPPGDSGVQRLLGASLGLDSPQALEGVLERLGEQRGYLYLCALGGSLLGRGLIRAAP